MPRRRQIGIFDFHAVEPIVNGPPMFMLRPGEEELEGGGTARLNIPNITMTTGQQGQAVGFRLDNFGIIAPLVLIDGRGILRLFVRNNNGQTHFKVSGSYPQDEFTSIEIVGGGGGILLTADAMYLQNPTGTLWRWSGTGNFLTDATVYAIEFL